MSRNRERQQELQPGRVDYARTRLEALGYPVTEVNANPRRNEVTPGVGTQ